MFYFTTFANKTKLTYSALNKRSIHIVFAIALTAMLALCACGKRDREYEAELSRAEALTDSLPDTALAITGRIPLESIRSPRLRALHTLVKTEARYKLYIDSPDDSLLSLAAAEFRSLNDRPRLMRTLFQLSLCKYYLSDYPSSLSAAVEAMDIAHSLNDRLYLARTNDHLGIIKTCIYKFRDAIAHQQTAAAIYSELGREKNVLYSKINCSMNFHNLGHYSEAITMLDSVIREIEPTDTVLLAYAYETKIHPCIKADMLAEAQRSDSLLHIYSNSLVPTDPVLTASVAINRREFTKARKIIDEAYPTLPEYDRIYIENKYYSTLGDSVKGASFYAKGLKMSKDSLMTIFHNCVDASSAESEFYQIKNRESSDRIKSNSLIFTTVFVAVIALSIFLLLFLLGKHRTAKKNNNILNEQAQSNEQLIRNLFDKQFKAFNMLCRDFYDKKDASDDIKITVLKDFENSIKSVGSASSFKEIESLLNKTHNGIVTKLYAALPELKNSDKKLLVYTMAGISAKAICIICKLKDASQYYNRRQALKKIISNCDSDHKNELLEILS